MLKRGTQIIYIPSHANGDINHPDCEQGFITSLRGDAAFCRYWSKFNSGLRTTANSELTYLTDLVEKDTHPQEEIEKLLEIIS